jgi:hypothetical protein
MRKVSRLSIGIFFIFQATAQAQQPEVITEGDGHGVGLGVAQNLGGLTGAAFSYDGGQFHVDVIGSFGHWNEDGPNDDDLTMFGVGGRFFYHLHEMPGADFSIGGGLALVLTEQGDFSDNTIHLEGAAQIRLFIVPNVALSGSLGLVVLTADDGVVSGGPIAGGRTAESFYGIGGQLNASLGVIYYFR